MEHKDINAKGDLKPLPLFLMGGALFSMHFGASSMVWPMNWGKESGSAVLLAFAGAFVTSLLLTLLAYVALARGEGTYNDITKKAMPKLGTIFTCITITILGPLYAIPRMSASAWDAVAQATGFQPSNNIPLILFSAAFYLITYFFLINPGKTMDRISALLFPILIVVVAIIIGKGIIDPIAVPQAPSYSGNPFAYGFTEGYATAEILCALVFGIVILKNLQSKGVSKARMNNNIIKVGIIGLGMLSFTHLGNMLVGASTGGTIDLNFVSLYTAVAFKLLGQVGGSLFAIALFFAALTTAIGLTAAAGEFFEDATKGKFSYKKAVVFTLVFSTIFGSLGLTSLLRFLSPILDAIYPAAIILVLYYAIMPKCLDLRRLNMCRWGMGVALVFGALDACYAYIGLFGLDNALTQGFVGFYKILPLSSIKLAWVPASILAFIIGYFVYRPKHNAAIDTAPMDPQPDIT